MLLYFSFEQSNKSDLFLVQEDLYVFLLIGPIEAPNVLACNVIHGVLQLSEPPYHSFPTPEKDFDV